MKNILKWKIFLNKSKIFWIFYLKKGHFLPIFVKIFFVIFSPDLHILKEKLRIFFGTSRVRNILKNKNISEICRVKLAVKHKKNILIKKWVYQNKSAVWTILNFGAFCVPIFCSLCKLSFIPIRIIEHRPLYTNMAPEPTI